MKNKVYMYARTYGWYQLIHDIQGLRWGLWFDGPRPYKEGLKNFVKLRDAEVAVQITLGLLPPTFSVMSAGNSTLYNRTIYHSWTVGHEIRFRGGNAYGHREEYRVDDISITDDSNVRIWVEK